MTKKWFWIYLELLRGLLFYVMVSITSAVAGRYLQLSMTMPNLANFWNVPLAIAVSLIFSLLLVFSLASTFATNHWQIKQEFLSVATEMTTLKKRAFFLLKNKAFQLEIVAFTLFFCLCYVFSPFYQEINLALSFLPLLRGARIWISVLISLVLSLLIVCGAYLSILGFWKKDYKRMILEHEDAKKPFLSFIGQCALRVALFCVAGFAFSFVIPMIVMACRTIALFGSSSATFVVFGVLLGGICTILFLSPALARRKLIQKIKKLEAIWLYGYLDLKHLDNHIYSFFYKRIKFLLTLTVCFHKFILYGMHGSARNEGVKLLAIRKSPYFTCF